MLTGIDVDVCIVQFCVVDHVVPREMVPAVYHELSAGMEETMAQLSPEERQRPGPNGTTMGANEIIYQPLYQQSLCHPAVVGIAQTILDAHVRIAQSAGRNVASDDQAADGERGGFGPAANRGPLGREWHTVREPWLPPLVAPAPCRSPQRLCAGLAARSLPRSERRNPPTVR